MDGNQLKTAVIGIIDKFFGKDESDAATQTFTELDAALALGRIEKSTDGAQVTDSQPEPAKEAPAEAGQQAQAPDPVAGVVARVDELAAQVASIGDIASRFASLELAVGDIKKSLESAVLKDELAQVKKDSDRATAVLSEIKSLLAQKPIETTEITADQKQAIDKIEKSVALEPSASVADSWTLG